MHSHLLRWIFISLVAALGFSVRAVAAPAGDAPLRLEQILWREVQNTQGETLGSVSDLLVQMPSGRIVFVAIVPAGFFERPKAVPPGALILPRAEEGPLQLDVSTERWLNAPRLDWDGAMVIKNTAEGGKVYGYYQQPWQDPDPVPPWGVAVVAQSGSAPPPARYVSLKKLLLNRVATHANQNAGYVHDFLIDWNGRRATHALVSPKFTPLAGRDALWFAVPMALLNPPEEHDAIVVNADVEAFRRAQRLPTDSAAGAHPGTVYRYPPPRAWR